MPEQTKTTPTLKSVRDLMALIGRSWGKIERIQKRCPHTKATRVAKSDTGNWDKGQDSYWYKCDCPRCGKHWTEDQ